MITDKDKLKVKLLNFNEHERLDRHADVEIAYAAEKENSKKLEEALKNKEKECAELRYDLKQIVDAHTPLEKRG